MSDTKTVIKETGFASVILLAAKVLFSFAKKSVFRNPSTLLVVRKLNNFFSNTLDHYMSFIVMMILFHILIVTLKLGYRYVITPPQNEGQDQVQVENSDLSMPQYNRLDEVEESNVWKRSKQGTTYFCKVMVCYTVIFGVFKLGALAFNKFSQSN